MKKTILSFCILFFVLLVFASCKSNVQNEQQEQPEQSIAEEDIYIVYDPTGVTEDKAMLVWDAVLETYNCWPIMISDVSKENDGFEIVIGKTEKTASKEAYRMLERMDRPSEEYVRFLIYSDGASVAIAYDDAVWGANMALDDAIDCFAEQCKEIDITSCKRGVIYKSAYNVIDKQRQIDEINTIESWNTTEKQLVDKYGEKIAGEAILALKNLYNLYTDEMVSWLADLYDIETGGFYYSNSGRNTVGFLPDIESTYQALAYIRGSGMLSEYNGSLKDGLPEWFGNLITKFVKRLQNENGYFYHPQWGKDLTDANLARRGRDLTNATRILEIYSVKPTYDTPNGVKGDGIVVDEPVSPVALTGRMNRSSVYAVSKVVPVSMPVPSHLVDDISFTNYLKSLESTEVGINISYYTANLLESQANQIFERDKVLQAKGVDYSLCDILEKWMNDRQNQTTGTWRKDNAINYDAVNAILKTSSIYSRINKMIPNVTKVAAAAAMCITSDEEIRHVCDILNPWYAIDIVASNVTNFSGNVSEIEDIKLSIARNSADAISRTTEKLCLLLRDDGSFGYMPESSSPNSQGMPVAISGSLEGDVNASYIAGLSIPEHIFNILGVSLVPMHTESDRLYFVSIIENHGAIIKDEIKMADVITFDEEDIGAESDYVNYTMRSSGSLKVAKNPSGKDNVLQLISRSDGSGKGSDDVYFPISRLNRNTECYVFESDMMVDKGTSEETFLQLYISPYIYMLQFSVKDGAVRLVESSSHEYKNSVVYDIGEVAKLGEWFNLRIEYYNGDAETVRIKIFINNNLAVVSDNYFDVSGDKIYGESHPGTSEFTEVKIVAYSSCNVNMYFDNVYADKLATTYTPALDKNKQPDRNIDAPDVPPTIYNFEDSKQPEEFIFDISGDDVTVTDSGSGKALKIVSGGGSTITVPATSVGSNANCGIFEGRLFVSEESAVGAKYEIAFMEYGDYGEKMAALHLAVMSDSEGKYLAVYDTVSGKSANLISQEKIPIGENLEFKIEYYYKESVMIVYIGGNSVGATINTYANSTRKYFSKVRLENISGDSKLEILLDDLSFSRTEANGFVESDRVLHDFQNGSGEVELLGNTNISSGRLSFHNAAPGDGAIIPVNVRNIVKTTGVFSLSILHDNGFQSGMAYTVALTDVSGNIIIALDFVGKSDGIAIYERTERGRYSTSIAEVPIFNNLEIAYSAKKKTVNIYVDGVCVAVSNAEYRAGSFELVYSAGRITTIDKCPQLYLISAFAETSTSGLEKINFEYPNSSDRLNYEDMSSAHIGSILDKEMASIGGTITVRESLVYGNLSKTLVFDTKFGGRDILDFKMNQVFDVGEVLVFETDMMVNADTKSSWIDFEPMSNGARACKMLITTSATGVISISGGGISSTKIAKAGEWFRFRLEYRRTAENELEIKIFVGGSATPIAVANTPYTDTVFDASEITCMRFLEWTDSEQILRFDNTYFGVLIKDNENEGNTPSGTLDGGLGSVEGDEFHDNEGWS